MHDTKKGKAEQFRDFREQMHGNGKAKVDGKTSKSSLFMNLCLETVGDLLLKQSSANSGKTFLRSFLQCCAAE